MPWIILLVVLVLLLTGAAYGLLVFLPFRTHLSRRLDLSRAAPDTLRFPAHFRFGASTAAHQVEGGNRNNWSRWEDHRRPDGRPGIYTGERCGAASGHWDLFDEDLERIKDLGLRMYRFSIEWSRIEPEEGRFDAAALERYRSWCERLLDAGITPMVTLYHFSEPLWITDRGGFENRDTVAAFTRFVEYVVPRLADVVDDWITINEPVVYALMGWYIGEFPPGKRKPRLMKRVLENLLHAHAAAYRTIHRLDTADADDDGVPCRVSIAKNTAHFEPLRWWHPADVLLAVRLGRLYNMAVLQALRTGRLRLTLPGSINLRKNVSAWAGTLDFIGVNHYFRYKAAFRLLHPHGFELTFDPDTEKNDMGWDLVPQSLYEVLIRLQRFGLPLYVTEHGICDAEVPDRRRASFLVQSLYALEQAIIDGVDVRAYLHWSLLDNFEWVFGFGPRFGLYRVDYRTHRRTLTEGGAQYRRIVHTHLEQHARPEVEAPTSAVLPP